MESLYKLEIGGTQLSVVLFDEAFRLQSTPRNRMAEKAHTFHRHSDFEIFLIKSGTLELVTEDGEATYATGILILPPFLNHCTYADDCNASCLYLSSETTDGHSYAFDSCRERITHLPLSQDARFYAERLCCPVHTADVPHLLSLLFSSLLRDLSPTECIPSMPSVGKRLQYINTIDSYVFKHAHERIRLSDLAQELYLCPKQVARIIKKEYGCSLSEHVHRHRMENAAALLCHTDMAISEISQHVGYEYENLFYSTFRKHYGVTPNEYRLAHVKKR